MILPASLLACATCLVDTGTDVANAAGTAVIFMVGLIGLVGSVFLYAIIRFAVKQRRYQQTLQQSHT